MNHFKIVALDNTFEDLFAWTDEQLKQEGMLRMVVDDFPGFPCRVSLEDAAIGEEVILLNYTHHRTESPYKASGPLFVRKGARSANLKVNEIPKMFRHRLLSLRGYDNNGMMLDACVTEGSSLEEAIHQVFSNPLIVYIHIHNAKPGCFNCVVNRG